MIAFIIPFICDKLYMIKFQENTAMFILLLFITVITASLNSTLLHKAKVSGSGRIYLYNLIGAAVWCIALFSVNAGKLYLDKNVLIWGFVYGITQALFILFKTAAMNSGPVSVTTLIGNSSLLVSVAVSYLLWSEPISVSDIIGLILLMIGIFLTTFKPQGGKVAKRWLFASIAFLLCAAAVGIIFKAFSKSGAGHTGDMMLVASVVMLITYTFMCFITKGFRSYNAQTKEGRTLIITAVVSGILSCLYNRLNIYLSGVLDAVIFFPAFNGGVMVLSTVLSVLFLRERLSIRQIVGLIAGVSGICIIGIF